MQGITGVNERTRIKMTIIDGNIYCGNSVNYLAISGGDIDIYFLLAIMNSRVINYIFSKFSTNSNVNGYEIDNLPLPNSTYDQKELIHLTQKILFLTNSSDYLNNQVKQANVKEYERQIDRVVYKLYGLTKGDRGVVENVSNG
jgi:hypothetical protein